MARGCRLIALLTRCRFAALQAQVDAQASTISELQQQLAVSNNTVRSMRLQQSQDCAMLSATQQEVRDLQATVQEMERQATGREHQIERLQRRVATAQQALQMAEVVESDLRSVKKRFLAILRLWNWRNSAADSSLAQAADSPLKPSAGTPLDVWASGSSPQGSSTSGAPGVGSRRPPRRKTRLSAPRGTRSGSVRLPEQVDASMMHTTTRRGSDLRVNDDVASQLERALRKHV